MAALDRNMYHWDGSLLEQNNQSKSSLEAAAEAADKVNAMLIAKGKLKPSHLNQPAPQPKPKSSSYAPTNLIIAEVDINDVPIGCRNMLTRGSTQEEIAKVSGSAVSTRGRYLSNEDIRKNFGERPLYLCVQGPTKDSVDIAVGTIKQMINSAVNADKEKSSLYSPMMPPPIQGTALPPPRLPTSIITVPPPLMSILAPQQPAVTLLEEKLFVGLEHAPPSFDVKGRLMGPGGCFLAHIQTECGAKITLRGKGSGVIELTTGRIELTTGREAFEPMFVHIQHLNPLGLQQAKQLAENLIQTVQQDYARFQQALAELPVSMTPAVASLLAGIQQHTSGSTLLAQQQALNTLGTVNQHAALGLSSNATNFVLANTLTSLAQLPMVTTISTGNGPIFSLGVGPPPPQSMPLDAGTMLPNTNLPPPVLQVSATSNLTQFEHLGASSLPPPQMIVGPLPPLAQMVGATDILGAALNPGLLSALTPTLPQGLQLVSQPPADPGLAVSLQAGPPPPQGQAYLSYLQSSSLPLSAAPSGVIYTSPSSFAVAPATSPFSSSVTTVSINEPIQPPKRRFTEEKPDDKVPENLLGYQHGPPHLTNLVSSTGPPPQVSLHPPGTVLIETSGQIHAPLVNLADGQQLTAHVGHPDIEDSRLQPPGVMHPLSDGTLLMPPPPPPASVDNPTEVNKDKQLMPPPSLPGSKRGSMIVNPEPERKKSKISIENTEGFTPDDFDGDETAQSAVGQNVKYSFNHYSNKAQVYSTSGSEEPLHLGGPSVLEIQHLAAQQQQMLLAPPPNTSIPPSSGLFTQSPPLNPIIYSQPPASNFVSCSQPPPLYSVAFSAAAPPTSIVLTQPGAVNSVVVSQSNPPSMAPVVFSQPGPLPGTVVLSQPAPPPPGVAFTQPPPIPAPNLGPGDQLIHPASLIPAPPTQTTLQFDVPPPQFEGPNHQPPVPQFDLTQHPPGFSEQGPEMIPQFIAPTTQGFNPNQPPPPTSFQTGMPAFVPQFTPPQSQPLTQFQPQPPVQYWMPPN